MSALKFTMGQRLKSYWLRVVPWEIHQMLMIWFGYVVLPFHVRLTINRNQPFIPQCSQPIQPPHHASYHKIQSFQLINTKGNGRETFLFYDIFARNNELFLLHVEEDHKALGIQHEDIEITINQQSLVMKEQIADHTSARMLIYAFDQPFAEHQIAVSCQGVTKLFTISHIHLEQTGMLLHTTLFRDDHLLLPMFYDYYTKQGVDSFVWYYNGVLDEELQKKYSFGDDVVILNWPYPYFTASDPWEGYSGQQTQMLHALYKYGKPSYEYIGFYDLDEYIKTEEPNLRKYLLQNPGYLSYNFFNCWSWILSFRNRYMKEWHSLPKGILRAKHPTKKTGDTLIENADDSIEKYHAIDRSKGIYKTTVKRIILHAFPTTNEQGDRTDKVLLIKSSSIFLHLANLRADLPYKILKALRETTTKKQAKRHTKTSNT